MFPFGCPAIFLRNCRLTQLHPEIPPFRFTSLILLRSPYHQSEEGGEKYFKKLEKKTPTLTHTHSMQSLYIKHFGGISSVCIDIKNKKGEREK